MNQVNTLTKISPISMKVKKNVPKLRFPEFSDEWQKESLRNHIQAYIERVKVPTPLPILTSSRSGLFMQKDYYNNREVSNEGEYGVIPRGYVTYRHMSDDLTFKFNLNDFVDKGAISKEYPVFRTINLNSYLLIQMLNNGNAFKRFAVEQKQGGTRTRLYFKKLQSLELLIPSIEEQQKIADLLSAVDEKITMLQNKVELLKKYKKGVMQKIFSQEVRFKDENGEDFPDWEEEKLGNLGNFIGGGTPSRYIDKYWLGDIPWVSSSDISEENIRYVSYKRSITEEAVTNSATKLIPAGSILVVSRVGVGKLAINDRNVCTSQDFINIIPSSINVVFLAYLLKHRISSLLNFNQGTSIKGFTKDDLVSLCIYVPGKTEQQKIADFLTYVDKKVNLEERRLEQTKFIKKALLQQMFL